MKNWEKNNNKVTSNKTKHVSLEKLYKATLYKYEKKLLNILSHKWSN